MKSVAFSKAVKVRYIDREGSSNKVVKNTSENFSYANIHAEISKRREHAIERAKETMATLCHNIRVYEEILKDMRRSNPDFEYFKELKDDSWFKLRMLLYAMKHY